MAQHFDGGWFVYSLRGSSPSRLGRDSGRSESRSREQTVGQGYQTMKPTPYGSLPPAKLYVLKVSKLSNTEPPAENT